jgi:hypothetical protein
MNVEPSRREFTPTFAGFCLLLTYVVVVTNLLGDDMAGPCSGRTPNKTTSFDSVARRHAMASYVDPTHSACTDFYNNACGQYLHQEALSPWQATQLKMTNRLKATNDYKTCTNIEAFWDTNHSVAQAAIGFNITAADFPIRDWAMARGFTVNGVVVRLGVLKDTKVYAPMLIADSDSNGPIAEPTEAACPCLPHPVVITYGNGDLCNQLCTPQDAENFTLKLPSDMPTDCVCAVKTFRMAASAPNITAEVTTQLRERFTRIAEAGNIVGVGFHVGGGPGHIADVAWGANVVDTWVAHAQAWNRLFGFPVNREAWPMSGWEANAFYTAEQHAVFVLSGVLEPPFYSPQYDNALLSGGIDFILAHELGHAYDHVNDVSAVRRRLIDVLVRTSHGQNRSAIQLTEHEDYADYFAANVIAKMPTTGFQANTTVYQFAQMWCGDTNGTFDGHDVHAPSRWRVNQTVQQLPNWETTFCP